MSGGRAAGGGIDFQARVIAYVAVRILSEHPLGWCELAVPDVPCAISVETGGPGDDFRVDIAENEISYEVQCKRGLNADRRLYETVDSFASLSANERGILAVSPNSSQTIRVELAEDLKRFAQGRSDNLRPTINKLCERLEEQTSDSVDIARLLSVIVFDIEEDTSPLRQSAIEVLHRILINPSQAVIVWDALVSDGLRLIREGGRRDADSLVNFLGSRGEAFISSSYAGSLTAYSNWLKEYTRTFVVPGLDISLSIENAWVALQAFDYSKVTVNKTLADQVAAYHEWERLAKNHGNYDAKDLLEFGNRIIVVGGPGSGKSTLCKRFAHDLATLDKRVLWVKLPLVERRLRKKGFNIEDAILETAADGSGVSLPLMRRIFQAPDFLILDGLDECINKVEVIQAIKRWSLARGSTRIAITTRPVGYSPAYFEDWEHIELLPLDPDTVDRQASLLLAEIKGDESQLEADRKQFKAQLQENRVASIAARSPLFLGFLVQLFHKGIDFGRYRAMLFERVIKQVLELEAREGVRKVDSTLAFRALEIIAWLQQEGAVDGQSYSKDTLAGKLAGYIEAELSDTPLNSKRLAHKCIELLQEKGILEQLHVDNKDTITFIHLSLQEYAAGRFASGLNDDERYGWLSKVRRDPRWREVILLAAGSGAAEGIVTDLLKQEFVDDPTATEMVLAAAALDEVDTLPPSAGKVIERLMARLESEIPMIALEAANALSGLAAQAPDLIADFALKDLYVQPQIWTRLAAIRLMLAGDPDSEDMIILEEIIDNPPLIKNAETLFTVSNEWITWNDIVSIGSKCLAEKKPTDETVERLTKLAYDGKLNVNAEEKLLAVLSDLGHPEVAKARMSKLNRSMDFIFNPKMDYSGDVALLDSIIRVTNLIPDVTKEAKFVSLGKMVHGMKMLESTAGSILALGKQRDDAVLDAVIKGAIAALDIDIQELTSDAIAAKKKVENEDEYWISRSVIGIVPNVPFSLDWERAKDIEIPADDLVRALNHPSSIVAQNAAQLLHVGVGGNEASKFAKQLLETGNDRALRLIVAIAETLWGDLAKEIILERLEGDITLGCRWLYEFLPEFPEVILGPRLRKVYIRGLACEDARLVERVASGLSKFDEKELFTLVPTIESALERWTENRGLCKSCCIEINGGYCRNCYVVPDSPRPGLIQIMFKTGNLSFASLLLLCDDERHDVVEVAVAGLQKVLTDDGEKLLEVVNGLYQGTICTKALDASLGLPASALTIIKDKLIRLFQAQDVTVRLKMLSALVAFTWLSSQEAEGIARAALNDDDPSVRDQAVKTVRLISGN